MKEDGGARGAWRTHYGQDYFLEMLGMATARVLGGATLLRHDRRWNDAARRKDAEEAQAARIAAEGAEAEKTLQPEQRGLLDAIARQALQVEVSAARAMSKARERHGNPPRIKASIARSAAPGAQAGRGSEHVGRAAAARAEAIRAAALWANHPEKFHSPNLAASIAKSGSPFNGTIGLFVPGGRQGRNPEER